MKIANIGGRAQLVNNDRAVDVGEASNGAIDARIEAIFDQWDQLIALARTVNFSQGTPVRPADLLPPVPKPSQVFAVALNYRPHAAEAGFEAPETPLVFTKFPSCITGPESVVTLPPGNVDWETELVAVIGRPTYQVTADVAWESVAALTIGQDLSERLLQSTGKPPQFSLGKSYPGFGPIGPWLVSPDELADPDDLALACDLSGEQMQNDRTSNMIFSVPALVQFLSGICPLSPGDLIFTGTPGGVGNRRTPQRFITADDVLVTRIEGLGEMRTTFRSASAG